MSAPPAVIDPRHTSGNPVKRRRARLRRWAVLALLGLTLSIPACGQSAEVAAAPSLGELVTSMSEPGGYFDTDNLVSNETSVGQVVGRLRPVGGVYLGVGPAQNFTYIARTRPRWAFIVDVRRDNMLHHLMLNAILAQSETPYEYLSRLFSHPLAEATEAGVAEDLDSALRRFEAQDPSPAWRDETFAQLVAYIEAELDFPLSAEDRERLRSFHDVYFREQLELRFRSHGRPSMGHYPSYQALLRMQSTDGLPGHFLASADDYAYVRSLARAGRIVPVVGDFGGPQALRAVARFVREQGEQVTTFYVSNVEFYLLRSRRFGDYVENVRALPLAEDALFIRSYFDYGMPHPQSERGHRSTLVLQRIPRFLDLYDRGAYRTYWDVCTVDYEPLAQGGK